MLKVSLIIASALMGLTFALSAQASPPPQISIPRIGVTANIGTSLSAGPVWWPRVGRPGEGTTLALAGHDITPVPGFHGHGPFHDLNLLRKGDRITITWHGRSYVYRVARVRIIASSNEHIADLTMHERLILTTCWPRGSSAFRYVVYALPA